MTMREVDAAIIGAGVAGLTAAQQLASAGLSVLVIERMGAGGQVMTVEHIGNFPGYPDGIAGFDLGCALQEQAEDAGAEFMLDTVLALEPGSASGRHLVRCAGESVAARSVIVAAGSHRRALGVPGEAAMEGRGLSHCAACDGRLYRGETVCVIGGGDSAVSEAAELAAHAAQVVLVFPREAPHAQSYLLNALARRTNVRWQPHSTVTAIEGDDAGVVRVALTGPNGERQTLAAQGVFVYAGQAPSSAFLANVVQRDQADRILTDTGLRTHLRGVYAAGDIRVGSSGLLIDAAADGMTAAKTLLGYLNDASFGS